MTLALAFDFGTKRIGIAIGDTSTHVAIALKAIPASKGIPTWSTLDQLIDTWNPKTLIIGTPIHMDGREQNTTVMARQFAAQLQKRYTLPLHEIDERLTTIEARQRTFDQGGFRQLQKTCIDSLAAQLILEDWFNSL